MADKKRFKPRAKPMDMSGLEQMMGRMLEREKGPTVSGGGRARRQTPKVDPAGTSNEEVVARRRKARKGSKVGTTRPGRRR